MPDPGLMPLPDSASDLDWSNLVDAAKAFEGKFSEYNTQKADPSACFMKNYFLFNQALAFVVFIVSTQSEA